MFFAIVSALLGPLIAVVYGASFTDDYKILTLSPKEDGDGPAIFFLFIVSTIVGFLECVTGISAAILCYTMNPDFCRLCRINNQQVKNKKELKRLK